MTKKFAASYAKKNPVKVRIIRNAVKRGVKQYAETFRRLADTAKAADQVEIIRLPGEDVKIGPGTVPNSTASVSQTSTSNMISSLRKASKLGIFDNLRTETHS